MTLPKASIIAKGILSLVLLLISARSISAHNLWIETNPRGTKGELHEAHIYLGEYAYGVRDDITAEGDMLGQVRVWLVKPDGARVPLEPSMGKNRLEVAFTPEQQGNYQLVLNVSEAPVVDWRDYGLGILKTNFFSSAYVRVGTKPGSLLSESAVASANALVVQPSNAATLERQQPLSFQVLFEGQPLAEQEVVLGYKGQWFKKVYTDEHGMVDCTFPWDGQYVIETIYTEEAPGTFQGKDYEAIRHTATFSIPAAGESSK